MRGASRTRPPRRRCSRRSAPTCSCCAPGRRRCCGRLPGADLGDLLDQLARRHQGDLRATRSARPSPCAQAGQPRDRVLERSGAARLAGERRLRGGQAPQWFIADYADAESTRLKLGLRFHCLLPSLNPNTELGRAAVGAYAAREGITADAFVKRMGETLTPATAGNAVLELFEQPEKFDRLAYQLGPRVCPLCWPLVLRACVRALGYGTSSRSSHRSARQATTRSGRGSTPAPVVEWVPVPWDVEMQSRSWVGWCWRLAAQLHGLLGVQRGSSSTGAGPSTGASSSSGSSSSGSSTKSSAPAGRRAVAPA